MQESSAEAAIEALSQFNPDKAKVHPVSFSTTPYVQVNFFHWQVLRDGHVSLIDARELVPGDIVEVAVGDRVPADMRILKVI